MVCDGLGRETRLRYSGMLRRRMASQPKLGQGEQPAFAKGYGGILRWIGVNER